MNPQQGSTPPRGQVSRLEEARRRRKRRKALHITLLCAAVCAVALWFVGVFGSGLTVVSDVMESARVGMMPGPGFPVRTGMAEVLQAEPLAGGFVALGDGDAVVYAANGRQLRAIQHGYARPALSVGHHRFCLYGRSGTEARIESRTRTLKTMSFDQPLLLCTMAQDGGLAAVTRSGRYAAELKVYDSGLRFVYGWNPTDAEGTPVAVAFSDDSRRLAVACIRAEGGEIGTGLYWLDLGEDQVAASAWCGGSTPVQLVWRGSDLLVVFDDHTALYNGATGEELARYEYDQGVTLLDARSSGKITALLLTDGMGGLNTRLVLLDEQLAPLGQAPAQPGAYSVVCTRSNAYSLAENSVNCYTLEGEGKWHLPLAQQSKALVDSKKLLLFTGMEVGELKAPPKGQSSFEDQPLMPPDPAEPEEAGASKGEEK